jgi:hypothetical protein
MVRLKIVTLILNGHPGELAAVSDYCHILSSIDVTDKGIAHSLSI